MSEDIVRKINKEYAQLLRETYQRDSFFLNDEIDFNELEKRLYSTNGLIISHQGKNIPSLVYLSFQIIDSFVEFWKSVKDKYLPAVKELSGFNLYTEDRDINLLTYFDTIITMDPVLPLIRKKNEIERALFIIIMLNQYKKLIPLLEADSDFPLIAIFPYIGDKNFGDSILNNDGEDVDPVAQRAEELSNDFLNTIKKAGSTHPLITSDLSYIPDEINVNLADLFDISKLKQFLEFRSEHSKSNDPSEYEVFEFLYGKRKIISGFTLKMLYSTIYAEFTLLLFSDYVSLKVNADPLVSNLNTFKTKMYLDGLGIGKSLNLSEEAFAARAMQVPPFQSLNNLEVDDIIRFREAGGIDIIRSVFRDQRKKIKFASIRDFDYILKSAISALSDVIKDHNMQIDSYYKMIINKKKKIRRKVKIGIGLLSLNLASIPFPWLSILLLPISVTLGGPTVLELIGDKKEIKKVENNLISLGCRPLGILAKHFNSNLDNIKK